MVIREVISEQDRLAVQRLLAQGFEVRPGVGRAFANLYVQVDNGRSFVAVEEGQVVGHVLLVMQLFHLDGLHVPGGILAMVVVDPKYQRRGIGRALVQRVEEEAYKAGALLLHVAGDPLFYMRLGYVPAYTQGQANVSVSDLTADEFVLRPINSDDVATLVALSNAEAPVGAVVADESRWQWVIDSGHPESLLQCNDGLIGFCAQGDACLLGDGLGFVRGCWDHKTLAIYESACIDQGAALSVLKNVCAWAKQLNCEQVAFSLPASTYLLDAVKKQGIAVDVSECEELQIKVLDCTAMMAQYQSLFVKRAQEANLTGQLALRVEDRRFDLDLGEGKQYEVFMPEIGFARALLGTDQIADRLGIEEDALFRAINVLFPANDPFFWLADSL